MASATASAEGGRERRLGSRRPGKRGAAEAGDDGLRDIFLPPDVALYRRVGAQEVRVVSGWDFGRTYLDDVWVGLWSRCAGRTLVTIRWREGPNGPLNTQRVC